MPGLVVRISTLYLLLAGQTAFGQAVTLVLEDNVTGQPVPYAHVRITSPDGETGPTLASDDKGIVATDAVPPFVITIRSIGYKELQDTIGQPGTNVIRLSPHYYELDQVVVTGQFRPQTADRSIYRISLIDARQIQLKAAGNIGDLLRSEPGFQLHTEGILGDFVRIRGLSGEYVKVLINGMPVIGRIGDRIDLGQISMQQVDHIEIIEGPMSVVYGSNALGGAINVITSDAPAGRFSATLDAIAETAGVYDVDAAFSVRHASHGITFHAARNFFGGWGPADTSRYKVFKPKLQYLLGGTYAFEKDGLSVQLTSDYLHEELRDQDSLSLANLYEKALDGHHFTKRWNSSLSVMKAFDNNLFLNVQAGYSYYNKSKITFLSDLVKLEQTVAEIPELHDTTDFRMISGRTFLSNGNDERKVGFQSGFDLNHESATGKRTQGYKEITDMALFLNIIYRPFTRLSLQPGIRLIHNSNFRAPAVYAMHVKYSMPHLTLYGSYGKGFRAPSLKQLYLQFIDSNHEIIGNSGLLAETADNVSLSAGYSLAWGTSYLQLDLSLFYNAIENAIQLAIDTLRPGWGTYFNVEGNNYKTKGLEAKASYSLYSGITMDAGIMVTGRKRLDGSQAFDYSTDGTAGMSYRNERYRFQAALFYKYTDRYIEYAGNYGTGGELNGIAERFIEGYHMLDVSLQKRLFRNSLTLTSGIRNLLDVTLVESAGNLNLHGSTGNSIAAGYGRSWFLRLNYHFEK